MDDQLSLPFQLGNMRNIFALFTALIANLALFAQDSTSQPKLAYEHVYHGFATKINDLVNTKLDVRFDYAKSYLYGKAWITLKPHFYPTDSLRLDAKGMDIHTVALVKGSATQPLQFTYDGLTLSILLDKTYKSTDSYVIYIDYTSKPNEFKVKGSAAIKEAKGLYFVNPLGTEKTNRRRFGHKEKQNPIRFGFRQSTNPTRNLPRR